MNVSGTKEDEIRNALDAEAKNYKPPTRSPFKQLMPFKGQIESLRKQKASFRTIVKLLERYAVQTTRETVRRFYHNVIEGFPQKQQHIRQRKKRRAGKQSPKTKMTSALAQVSQGEPRIARIEDL